MKPILALAAVALGAPLAAQDTAEAPTPASIVAGAPAADWRAIDPADLLVMTLAADRDGNPRQVVIELLPPPLSQPWVGNVRQLARAHWWDGTSVYRVVDNWVAQWGDGEDDETKAKPLPDGLRVVPESEYVTANAAENLFQTIVATDRRAWPTGPYSDRERFFQGWHALVVRQGQLRAADGRHVGTAPEVVARHMHFILRQRVHDVGHALACVLRVAGFREAGGQLAESFEGVLGRFLVALGKILARDEREEPPSHSQVL